MAEPGGSDTFVQLPVDAAGKLLAMLDPGTGHLIQVVSIHGFDDLALVIREQNRLLQKIVDRLGDD